MDFSIPEELRALQAGVRDFVTGVAIPAEPEIERAGRLPDALLRGLRDVGLFGYTIPEAYGGLGVGPLGNALISEELGRAHSAIRALVGVNNGIGSRMLVLHGSEAQKRRYLPRLASGEFVAAFALSEPGAGSDAAAIETRAEPRGDGWVLHGSKHFITNGPIADVLSVLAVTDRAKRARGGISAFLVEKGTPGLVVGRRYQTMGSDACARSEIAFQDCAVPGDALIGTPGRGFEYAMACLSEGRISYAAFCVGTAQRLLDASRDYAKQRVQFGRPIAEFQAIQFMLAETAAELYGSRMATLHAAWKCERGEECGREASMAKLLASEMAGRAADRAVQIHGAMGYSRDLAIERLYRDARLYRIAEGTSEIQKLVIARSLLGEKG